MQKALYFLCIISLAISSPAQMVYAEDWSTRCNTLAGSPLEPGNANGGVPFDKISPVPAIAACQKALRNEPNSAVILFRLGRAYQANNEPSQAFRYFEASAKMRYTPAQNNLGVLYQTGAGVVQDIGKAVEWYSMAGASGLSVSQRNLGLMHYFGNGIPRNNSKAAKWLTKAAHQEDAIAEFYLGNMYYYGDGLEQNYAEAVKWHERSGNHGNSDALAYLAIAYYYGQAVRKDVNKAAQFYSAAMERKSPHAYLITGQMHSRGVILSKNKEEAKKYLRLAEASGDPIVVATARKEIAALETSSAGATQGLTGGQIVAGIIALGLGAALLAGSGESKSETPASAPEKKLSDDPYADDPCSNLLITPQTMDEWAVASAFGCPPKF